MYGKIFAQIYDSSLCENWKAMVTFQQLIVLCDSRGVVDMTQEAISRRTNIPLEIIREGIESLEQPDPRSRSDVADGRRLSRLDAHRDWGWQIVNHTYYQRLASMDEKREADRVRIADKRKKGSKNKDVAGCRETSQGVADVAYTDAYADQEASLRESSPLVLVSDLEDQEGSNKRLREPKSPGALAFDAYAEAYGHRYAVDPVVNAKVRGIFAQLVKRLGAEDAIAVAGWYPTHSFGLYVRSGHAVDLLLRDAEKLRTEWATGTRMTDVGARHADRREHTRQVFGELLRESANG